MTGLDEFGLNRSKLWRLGSTRVEITARLDSYRLTSAVVSRSPSERHKYLNDRANRWVRSLQKRWPTDSFSVIPSVLIPTEIKSTVKARDVREIEKFREVSAIVIERIEGKRRRRKFNLAKEFYCVRAKVAIQIEGITRGNQTWEDRFVLVLASDFEDAEEKLEKEWKEYEAPYLNSDGQMVRWKLEEVVDVYL